MEIKNYLVLLSFIIVAMICIGSVAAAEDNNVTDDSLALEISDKSDISINQEEANVNGDELGISNDSVLSEPQTIVVEEVELNHNEMGSSGTIQKAINSNSVHI